ncbi:MAG: hypothetical protein R3200_07290 [Xanthomonadales bacterium]|nr:hypothetical protein [Xanthomonadales bacterium]
MRIIRYAVVVALLGAGAAWADHHGRGQEPTDGFPGVYDAGPGRITFTGDGHLIMVMRHSNVVVAVQTYTVEDDVLTVRDISPPAFFPEEMKACAREHEARYAMNRQESSYTLETITDPCPARAGLFNGLIMSDYVRPEPKA